MTPLQSHGRKQQAKLISSKFLYHSPKEIPKIKRVTVAAHPRAKGSSMAVAMLLTSFGQKPNFIKKKVARSTTFRLQQFFVSQNKNKALASLNILLRTFFPYQKESKPLVVLPSKNKIFSWSMPKCRAAAQVDPFSFTYTTNGHDFDFVCSVQQEARSLTEAIFFLRLSQIPIQLG